LLLPALETSHGDLHGSRYDAKQGDFPAALQPKMLGGLPSDEYAKEDGDRQDQFIH
jgi:hypothetical protein